MKVYIPENINWDGSVYDRERYGVHLTLASAIKALAEANPFEFEEGEPTVAKVDDETKYGSKSRTLAEYIVYPKGHIPEDHHLHHLWIFAEEAEPAGTHLNKAEYDLAVQHARQADADLALAREAQLRAEAEVQRMKYKLIEAEAAKATGRDLREGEEADLGLYKSFKYTGFNARALREWMGTHCLGLRLIPAPAEGMDDLLEIMADTSGHMFVSVHPILIQPGAWLVRSDLNDGSAPIFTVMDPIAISHLRSRHRQEQETAQKAAPRVVQLGTGDEGIRYTNGAYKDVCGFLGDAFGGVSRDAPDEEYILVRPGPSSSVRGTFKLFPGDWVVRHQEKGGETTFKVVTDGLFKTYQRRGQA